MKFFSIVIFLTLLLLSPQKIFALTIFEDNFNVTGGGGDANYQYNSGTRQSGTVGNITYGWWFSTNIAVGYVTNAGPHEGQLFLPEGGPANGLGGTIAPDYNFTDAGAFSIEMEFHQTGSNDWTALNFGKNGLLDNLWNDPGMGFMFYPNGYYNVYDHWQDNHPTGGFMFAELAATSNPVLKVRITVSQPGGFPPTGDAKVALFINDIPYPLVTEYDSGLGWNVNKYIHTYKGGFSNNYINIGANVDIGIDNLKVTTAPNSVFENSAWTNPTEAGISDSILYTHAVNFNRATDVSINSVTFQGSPTNNVTGENWALRNDANALLLAQNIAAWGYNPNVTPECLPLLTNCLYDAWTCGGIVLSGLDPTLKYKITLYNTGFEPVGTAIDSPRPSFFATSDGTVIQSVNQNPYGRDNASITTYKYMPSAKGNFGFSTTTATASNWIWYAFSNEVLPPDAPGSVSASQGTFSDRVRVAWTSVDGAQFYSVFRGDNNIFSSASEIQFGIVATNYDDSSVTSAQNYYYWVKAANTGGVSSATGPALGYASSPNPPNKPTNLSPTSFDIVTAPALLTADAFSDPGGFDFSASYWEVSQYDNFSYSYFKSGKTIARNFFTAPANIIKGGTNYWRVKYMNEFSSWSDWSDGTSFIYVPGTNAPMTFFDSFSVTKSGDANQDYDISGRESGDAAPLTYQTEGTTKTGNSSNPNWLTLGQDSGVSPNHSFLEDSEFKVEFDIKPHELDGSADWCSIGFGKENQASFLPSESDGFGNLFYANGTFQTYSRSSLVGDVTGLPVGESLHVVISAKSKDFEYEPATIAVFVNDQPMVVDSTTLPVGGMTFYDYLGSDGFFEENFISFFNNNENSSSASSIDNFIVKPAEDVVTAHHWTGDSDAILDSADKYTLAVNLNGENDLTIDGVTFKGTGYLTNIFVNGAPEMTKTNWALTASGNAVGFHTGEPESNFVSGTSHDLAKHFAFPHGSFGFHLFNLIPYSSNSLYIYTVGFDPKGAGRIGRFASSYGGAITNIDMDLFDKGGGLIVQYDYIASEDGKFSLAISPAKRLPGDAPCFHVSAFANVLNSTSAPILNIDRYLCLGEVIPGNNQILNLEIKNAGGGIVSGTIADEASPFSLAESSYSATAPAADTVSVTFTPLAEGFFTNTITLTGIGGNEQVTLTGMGVPEGGIVFSILFSVFGIYISRKKFKL